MADDLGTTAQTLLTATTRRLQAASEILRTLVEFDTSSLNLQGLTEAAAWIAGVLRSLGLTVERRDSGAQMLPFGTSGRNPRGAIPGRRDRAATPGGRACRPARRLIRAGSRAGIGQELPTAARTA